MFLSLCLRHFETGRQKMQKEHLLWLVMAKIEELHGSIAKASLVLSFGFGFGLFFSSTSLPTTLNQDTLSSPRDDSHPSTPS